MIASLLGLVEGAGIQNDRDVTFVVVLACLLST